ncbi:MAG: helix-turn-helix domain-containing protein [Candidatus Hydrogenedentes bacterium]|nr:helix-turn-helix domain-containing protein [Candidatus Hydrogenedentota bacterium]
MPETWLTVRAAAAYLSITPSGLYKMQRRDPQFPRPSRLGRCPRYALSELDAYLRSKQPKPLTPDPELDREAAEIILKHRRPKIVSE